MRKSERIKIRIFRFVTVLLALLVLEVLFRIFLALMGREIYSALPPKQIFRQACVSPDPFRCYRLKPDWTIHWPNYGHSMAVITSLGFRSTAEFDVETQEKAAGTYRVAVIGGSSAMSMNNDEQSWCYWLGRALAESIVEKKIEILNAGVMGYTSTENLIDLALRVVDYDCDAYVLYLGVNDWMATAPDGIYCSDYTHCRRSIHEAMVDMGWYKWWYWLTSHSKLMQFALELTGIHDCRDLTLYPRNNWARGYTDTPEFLEGAKLVRKTAVRNVRSMIGIVRAHQPDASIILCSHYDLADTVLPYERELNADLHDLAIEMNLLWADPAKELPRDPEMTYDTYHFKPQGERLMAQLIARVLSSS